MERRVSVNSRIITILIVVGLTLLQSVKAGDRVVVLVTSSGCAMETISTLDVRKAYLGLGVSFEGRRVVAFRLNNDDALNQVFFQSVVAMSRKTYERRLLLLLLKFGRPRPPEYNSVDDLVNAIDDATCNIAYMWQGDLYGHTGVKVLKVLWQEN